MGERKAGVASEAGVEAWRRMRALTHHPDVLGRVHQMAHEAGITPSLVKALVHLSADRPTPMRELATSLRCDNSYVTSVVDGLEEHGLARRMPHPKDRRIKVIELTESGAELAGRAQSTLDQPPASFAELSRSEMSLLVDLLDKL